MVCKNTAFFNFREVIRACLEAVKTGHVTVKNVEGPNDGVIDIDDYIEQIKQEEKDCAKLYNIASL